MGRRLINAYNNQSFIYLYNNTCGCSPGTEAFRHPALLKPQWRSPWDALPHFTCGLMWKNNTASRSTDHLFSKLRI